MGFFAGFNPGTRRFADAFSDSQSVVAETLSSTCDTLWKAAEFPGGMEAMKSFIKQNMTYPQNAMDYELQGVCKLTFTVTSEG